MTRLCWLRHGCAAASAWLSVAWFYLSTGLGRRILVGGCGIAVVCVAAFAVGHHSAGHSYRELVSALEDFVQDFDIEWQASDSWDMRFAMLEQDMKVAHEKSGQLENLLQDSLLTIEELNEQIYFYKSVVAPEDLTDGIAVFSTTVQMAGSLGEYFVEVVLRRTGKTHRMIGGEVRASVFGTMADDRNEITRLEGETAGFSFRYFQRVRGVLRLQQGFVPERLTVTVLSKRFAPLVKTYAWHEIATGLPLSSR